MPRVLQNKLTRLSAPFESGNDARHLRVYPLVENTPVTEGYYRCRYCRARLDYGTRETLTHVVRHLGEGQYLASYHRDLERRGYDELSAHLLTMGAAKKLAGA